MLHRYILCACGIVHDSEISIFHSNCAKICSTFLGAVARIGILIMFLELTLGNTNRHPERCRRNVAMWSAEDVPLGRCSHRRRASGVGWRHMCRGPHGWKRRWLEERRRRRNGSYACRCSTISQRLESNACCKKSRCSASCGGR